MDQDPQDLWKLINTKMPHGKYAGLPLIDLPEPYVVWCSNKGLPEGDLGRLLELLYEIKVNGLEYLFEPMKSWIHTNPIK